jgi:hypothetical protein
MLGAIVCAAAALILLDPTSGRRARLWRVCTAVVFAALAFVILARVRYASARDFEVIATIAFLAGLAVDALIGDLVRAGMRLRQ